MKHTRTTRPFSRDAQRIAPRNVSHDALRCAPPWGSRLNARSAPSGYTLLELLVAMSIASLMLFLITRIFFDTTAAVSQGVATSRVIAGARTIGEALDRDFAAMVGPGESPSDAIRDGILVIVNKRYSDIQVFDPQAPRGESLRYIRSDQIAFIRRADAPYKISPMTPRGTGTFANSSNSERVRVWYGHLERTAPNGQLANTSPSYTVGSLGNPDTGPTPPAIGTNQYGNLWILGRQSLFFDASASPVYAIYSGTSWDWAVAGGYTGNTGFYMGLTDMLALNFGNDTTAGTFVYEFANASTATDYVAKASLFTFAVERLRTNPLPQGATFTSQQIAQTHAHFMDGVSDFIVEFAGDYYDNGTGAPGNDGLLDTYSVASAVDMNGLTYSFDGIRWYGHFDNDPSIPATYDSTSVAVFRIPIGDGGFNDTVATPTAPLYAANAIEFPLASNEGGMVVFRHDDKGSTSRWPSLVRIRYRLNDPKGELRGVDATAGDGQPGKSFEVILRVNRP